MRAQVLCPVYASYLSRRHIVTRIGMQLMDFDNNWYAGHGHERKEMPVILSNHLLSEMQ